MSLPQSLSPSPSLSNSLKVQVAWYGLNMICCNLKIPVFIQFCQYLCCFCVCCCWLFVEGHISTRYYDSANQKSVLSSHIRCLCCLVVIVCDFDSKMKCNRSFERKIRNGWMSLDITDNWKGHSVQHISIFVCV